MRDRSDRNKNKTRSSNQNSGSKASGKNSQRSNKSGPSNNSKTTKQNILKALKISIVLLIILIIIVGVGAITVVYSYVKDAPEFNPWMLRPPVTSYIYDRYGNEITSLYDEQNRIEIPLESIPEHVQSAFIAIEDERFYEHLGVDPFAIARAFVINLRERHWTEQGGSTITQQLVKTAFLTPEKTLRRKVQEAWLALKMERQYSKSEILEMYLNQIYFAHGAYGIEAAANLYFNKRAHELTIAEAALLAGIPRSPNYYSPFMNYESAMNRQSLVLSKMHELEFINFRELDEAGEKEIVFGERPTRQYAYPYFIDYVLHHELIDILTGLPEYDNREEAYEAIYTMGLKVYTTLDTNVQSITEGVLADESLYPQNITVDMDKMKELLRDSDYSGYPEEVLVDNGIMQPQAAAVVAHPVTGEVMALVGGRQYSEQSQDLRYLSRRQPGSAIKPIVSYAPAMEENLITPGSIIDDSPFARGSWAPENFDRRFRGLVTAREALVHSLNVPAVRVFSQLSPQIGLEYAKQMGIGTIHADDYNLATTLGGMTHGVTTFDMAQAYAVLANQGIKVDFYTVKKIKDRNDQLIYEHRSEPTAVLSPQTAYLNTDILKDVVHRGTAARLRIGRPVAAKTGTTSDNRDACLVAYTPDLVVSFWMGHDIPRLGRIAGGSSTTVPFMNAIMSQVLEDVPPSDFTRPSGITGPISICKKSGLRPGEYCPSDSIVNELFPTALVPQEKCNLHLEMDVCIESGLLPGDFCPPDQVETKIFLNRPDFELTDERWRGGAGRGPEDAQQAPPTEHCEDHSQPAPRPGGLTAQLLEHPLRVHLRWEYQHDIVEYRVYRRPEGEDEFTLRQKLPGTNTQYIDDNVSEDRVYIYRLVGVNYEGVASEPTEWVMYIPGEDDDQNGPGDNDTENERPPGRPPGRPPAEEDPSPGEQDEDEGDDQS